VLEAFECDDGEALKAMSLWEGDATMPLNTDQKRFLSAALAELEGHLMHFERLLQSDETVTIFQRVPNPFTVEQRLRLLELITAVKEHLAVMRDAFGLPVEVIDLRWQLTATLLHIATSLEECHPRRMKGFGELDTETAIQLSQSLQQLANLLEALQHEARR
jgi:hypothetical protein